MSDQVGLQAVPQVRRGAGFKLLKPLALFICAAVLVGLPYVLDGYSLHLAILAGIAAIAATSLNLIMGYVGKLSLGHAAFYGIGAYTTGLLSMYAGVPTWLSILAAPVAAMIAALLIGPLVLWLRGAYFIIVTLSFSIVIQLVVVNWVDLTNGPMGVIGLPAPAIGSLEFGDKKSYFYLVVASAVLTIWFVHRLINSRTGRAFE